MRLIDRSPIKILFTIYKLLYIKFHSRNMNRDSTGKLLDRKVTNNRSNYSSENIRRRTMHILQLLQLIEFNTNNRILSQEITTNNSKLYDPSICE